MSSLFESLQASLSQRKGFGTLLSLLCSLEDLGEKCEKGLVISPELQVLLQDNVTEALHVLQEFHKMSRPVEAGSNTSTEALEELIQKQESQWKEYCSLRHQRLWMSLNNLPAHRNIPLTIENWRFIVNELVLNAIRFSPQNSSILLLLRQGSSQTMELQVMNRPELDARQREILIANPERLLDPFFRASHLADDRFPVTDLGIGLTYLRKLLHSVGGSIFLEPGQDHTQNGKLVEVLITRLQVPWILSEPRVP